MAFFLLSSALLTMATAEPQAPWAHSNPFPPCAFDCYNSPSPFDHQSQCTNTSAVDAFNSCISSSSCSDSDKSNVYKGFAQLCADSGATVTAPAEATFSVTSASNPWASQWASFTGPWGSQFSAWTSAHGTAWSGMGPFGGPGNGWGNGPWTSGGPWASGPWTSWWGDHACPPSTWSGWTDGPWATDAPWTSWTACAATTTATRVVTATTTGSGTTAVQTSTSFGVQVNQATGTGSTSSHGNQARATDVGMVGSAAGVVGVVAGALLL